MTALALLLVALAALGETQDASTWVAPSRWRVALPAPWRVLDAEDYARAARAARVERLKPALGGVAQRIEWHGLPVETWERIQASSDGVLVAASGPDRPRDARNFVRVFERDKDFVAARVDGAPTTEQYRLDLGARVLTLTVHAAPNAAASVAPPLGPLLAQFEASIPARIARGRTRLWWLAMIPFVAVVLLLWHLRRRS